MLIFRRYNMIFAVSLIAALVLPGCGVHKRAQIVSHQGCNRLQSYDLNLPRVDEMLQQLAHATGCFIEMDDPALGKLKAHPVSGEMTIREAVELALSEQPVKVTQESEGVLRVTRQPAPANP